MRLKLPEINFNRYQLWTIFALFWIGLGWLGLFLALLGIFYAAILAAYILCGSVILIYLVAFNKDRIIVNHRFFLVFVLALASIFIFAYYTTPTIFSGRDQGSLSEAAIQLSQNHQLEFSFDGEKEFFKIYGPGQALNFPGFNYTKNGGLITQFPLGYISWLAVFYSIFGINGFIMANSIIFFVFLFSFYLTTRYYLRASSSLIALLLVLTSFVFSWFFKFTLSENMALGLAWFGIYEFVLFTKDKDRFYLLASLLSFGLLSFARVEATAFLMIIAAILLFKYKDWKYLLFVVIGKKILMVVAGIALVYVFNIAIDSQFYVALIKGMIKPFISYKNDIAQSANLFASVHYVLRVFLVYAIFDFLILGFVGFVYLLKHKKFEILIPYLIVLPSFIYLVNPSISSDHPWMLRRFLFAVVPISIFYAVWFLDWFLKKRAYFYLLSGALLVSNLIVFVPYIAFSPDKNLLPQIKGISENFRDTDLIFVDRDATGDGWSMMTGPLNFLYGKQAVYFFNQGDLAKINTSKFSSVYFIIPDEKLGAYKKSGVLARLVAIKDYKIEIEAIGIKAGNKYENFRSSVELPQIQNQETYGKIYILKK